MPLAAHRGITSFSGRRHSSEYCGWLEQIFSTLPSPDRLALILSAGHSENPIQHSALPGADCVAERRSWFPPRRIGIVVAMTLIEIDIISAQTLKEAGIELLFDLRPRKTPAVSLADIRK